MKIYEIIFIINQIKKLCKGCSDIRIIGTQKREWSISPPDDMGMSVNKQPTIVKKEQIEPEEEQTLISKSLLQKLYSELKRLKQVEKEYLANKDGKIIPNEIYEEREIKTDSIGLQEYLPQEVQDLNMRADEEYQEYNPNVIRKVLKKK